MNKGDRLTYSVRNNLYGDERQTHHASVVLVVMGVVGGDHERGSKRGNVAALAAAVATVVVS